MDDAALIFISYASPDFDRVIQFYDQLASARLNVWLDKHRLKGGQNWDFEIKRALGKAAVVIVFLSENSVDRRGYVQREIKIALDYAQEKLVDDIYIIPVMLDQVDIPEQLRNLHVIDANDSGAIPKLVNSIAHQLEKLGVETERVQGEAKLRWSFHTYKENWEGVPGYDLEHQLPRLSSEEQPQVSQITDVLKGWLASCAMAERSVKFGQRPDMFNFGDPPSFRQNSWDASCGDPRIKERAISIAYSVWWYAARAAHPNQFFRTFAFTLGPVTQIETLGQIFEDENAALEIIREEARKQLLEQEFEGMTLEGNTLRLVRDYVESGTKEWSDFTNFVFAEDAIELLFSSYQVAPYAFGPQFASIQYRQVAKLMKKEFVSALGISHMQSDLPAWPSAETQPLTGAEESAAALPEGADTNDGK